MEEEKNKEKVYWLADSQTDKEYKITVWYRCVGVEDFVKLVESKGNKVVGIIFSDNNLGFVLDQK